MRTLRLLPLAALLVALPACDSNSEPGPPVSAEIIQVTVLDVPLEDPTNGNRWDGSSDGDVYFRLYDVNQDFRDLDNDGGIIQGRDFGADRFNARDDGNVRARNSEDPWFDDVNASVLPLIWDIDEPYIVRDLSDQLYFGLADYDATNDDDPMGETEVFVLDDFAPSVETGRAQVITLDGVGLGGNDVRMSITVIFRD